MVVSKSKDLIKTLIEQVKNGTLERTKEHKMLGTWINEKGNYELNIKKNYMISIVTHQGSPRRVCVFSCQVRIKLAETMIILYSSEAFPYISTPFYALLM